MQPPPNSKEWIEALEKINPKQAAMTRGIVQAAGREDVCSVCGDTPAKDYREAESPLLIRLCADCRPMQEAQGARLSLAD